MTTKKSLNKEFGEEMDAAIQNLMDNHKFHKASTHVEFDASKVVMPEGINLDSLEAHNNFINNLALQAESATAQIARKLHGEDDKITTLDGTLKFGTALEINSTHHLRQQIGEEHVYGISTTAVDFHHDTVQADWLSNNRSADQDLAKALFSK